MTAPGAVSPRIGLSALAGFAAGRRLGAILAAAAILPLAAAAFVYFENWPAIWDISLWDETNILGSSIHGWYGRVTDYELQPGHMVVYESLGRFITDPVVLFQTAGLAVVVFALAGVLVGTWSLSRNLLFATLSAALFIACGWLMYDVRAMYTAIGVLGFGLPLALRQAQFTLRAAGLAVVGLVLTFIRPEFVLSFYLLLALTAVGLAADLVRPARRRAATAGWPSYAAGLAAYAVIGIAVCLAFSFPLLSGTERDFLAFGQHYARRWVDWSHASIVGGLNWRTIVTAELPGAGTELQALWLYPGKVVPFILDNVRDTGPALRRMTQPFDEAAPFFRVAAVVAVGLFVVSVARRARRARDGAERRRLLADLVLLLPFLLPDLAAVILVFPVERYLVLLLSALLLMLARLVRGAGRAETAAAAVLSAIFAATVTPAPAVQQPALAAIEEMRRLRPIARMLEVGKGWCAYLPQPCARFAVFGLPPEKDIRSVLEANRIDAVLVSQDLVEFATVRKDRDFLDWLADPPPGWSRHELPDNMVLYLRE